MTEHESVSQDDDTELDEILVTLIHTYLAKITKPANNTELEAYNKKVAKLQEVFKSKIEDIISTREQEAYKKGYADGGLGKVGRKENN